jgi:hypothetical protein
MTRPGATSARSANLFRGRQASHYTVPGGERLGRIFARLVRKVIEVMSFANEGKGAGDQTTDPHTAPLSGPVSWVKKVSKAAWIEAMLAASS